MKALPTSALLLLAVYVPAAASVPEEHPEKRYEPLWTDSPFTNEREPDEPPPPAPNPLDDFTLASLCRLGDQWHVVLLNKKQRDERVQFKSGEPNAHGFRIVTVDNPPSRRQATVEIRSGTHTATLRFESEFLQLRKTPVAGKNPQANAPAVNNRVRQPLAAQPRNVRRIPLPNGR